MALSAPAVRNGLSGTVTGVATDGLMTEVVVELGDGQEIPSTITKASVDRLGLEVGDEAKAVVKVTEVMVEKQHPYAC